MRSTFCHATRPTTGTEAATLAAERDPLFGITVFTTNPQKAMLQTAIFEVFLKLALNLAGQGFVLGRHLGQKCRVVPIHDLVKKGMFGAVSLVGAAILSLPVFLRGVHPARSPGMAGGWFRLSGCRI
jgi:hypothetical protein